MFISSQVGLSAWAVGCPVARQQDVREGGGRSGRHGLATDMQKEEGREGEREKGKNETDNAPGSVTCVTCSSKLGRGLQEA